MSNRSLPEVVNGRHFISRSINWKHSETQTRHFTRPYHGWSVSCTPKSHYRTVVPFTGHYRHWWRPELLLRTRTLKHDLSRNTISTSRKSLWSPQVKFPLQSKCTVTHSIFTYLSSMATFKRRVFHPIYTVTCVL